MNGTTAYAQAANAAELNPSNWTFEVWFRDDNPSYNHGRTRILTKGATTGAEVPYFASISSNVVTVGLRSGGNATVGTFNLAAGGISPNAWHHLAASFQASTRTLTIYIDGVQRAQSALAFNSVGNTSPLMVGRSGPSGDYWRGRLDDLRLWSVVRTPAEIAANYQIEINAATPGLVGNWHFNEGLGASAADVAGASQNLSLLGAAGWSIDVAPPLVGP